LVREIQAKFAELNVKDKSAIKGLRTKELRDKRMRVFQDFSEEQAKACLAAAKKALTILKQARSKANTILANGMANGFGNTADGGDKRATDWVMIYQLASAKAFDIYRPHFGFGGGFANTAGYVDNVARECEATLETDILVLKEKLGKNRAMHAWNLGMGN